MTNKIRRCSVKKKLTLFIQSVTQQICKYVNPGLGMLSVKRLLMITQDYLLIV